MLGYSDDPHLGLYLLCCLPQAAKLLSPQLTINRSWNKRLETVASKPSKGQVEKAERRGTRDQEGEEKGEDEAEKESTDQTSPENTALGILKHFQSVRKTNPEILKCIKIKKQNASF